MNVSHLKAGKGYIESLERQKPVIYMFEQKTEDCENHPLIRGEPLNLQKILQRMVLPGSSWLLVTMTKWWEGRNEDGGSILER